MTDDKDPPSTRCTFVIACTAREPFDMGAPGDRLELVEERAGQTTGRLVTARILRVQHIGPRRGPPPRARDAPRPSLLPVSRSRYDIRRGSAAIKGDSMNELVALVSQKTGLSEEHARLAVDTVVGFLKTKLPAPLASQIDGVLSGGGAGAVASALGGAGLGALGDMFKK